jgi:hypothetical protein
MRKTCGHFASMAVLGLFLATPSALAQTSGDKAAAEALFTAGRDLMNAGKFADACTKFEASQRLDAGLGTLLYLADCYEKANRLASAWATFKEAESIAMGRSDEGRAQVARQRYSAIEPKLSKLWIKVADGNDPATDVRRDGEPVPRESWGIALPTDAGDHLIEASAPGRKPWSSKVVVAGEGNNVAVDVPVLETAPVTATTPSTTTSAAPIEPAKPSDTGGGNGPSTQRTLGLVFGGVGIAGVALGSYFGLRAKSKNHDSLADCQADNHNLCTSDGVNLRNAALSSARLSTAFMIGGGALLVGGVVVYLTAPNKKSTTGASSNLHLAAGALPGAARVSLEGAW